MLAECYTCLEAEKQKKLQLYFYSTYFAFTFPIDEKAPFVDPNSTARLIDTVFLQKQLTNIYSYTQ